MAYQQPMQYLITSKTTLKKTKSVKSINIKAQKPIILNSQLLAILSVMFGI